MAGRTHGMQALPTTFGFKVAVWLDEFIRHLDRLDAITPRLLTGNISERSVPTPHWAKRVRKLNAAHWRA